MSTLNHTSEAALQLRPARRLALIAALIVLTAAALAAAIIAFSASSSSNDPQPTQAQINRQLESVAGPRYGLARPASTVTPQEQLQAVAGARYHQPVGR